MEHNDSMRRSRGVVRVEAHGPSNEGAARDGDGGKG